MLTHPSGSAVVALALAFALPMTACQTSSSSESASLRAGSLNFENDVLRGETSTAVGDLGRGLETSTPVLQRDAVTPADLARFASLKPQGQANAKVDQPVTPTDETIQWLASKDPSELVEFSILLPERPFAWHELRSAGSTARNAIIQRRQTDLQTVQAPLVDRLKTIGAEILGTRWLANAIDARFPARLAKTVAAWPEVQFLEHNMPFVPLGTPVVGESYYGADRRGSIHAERLLGNGFKGQKGAANNPALPVRLGSYMVQTTGTRTGTIVNDLVPKNHPGFKSSGSSRFYAYETCDPVQNPPVCVAGADPTSETHDTAVMGVMGGSIEAGQDSRWSMSSDQADRSGIAPLAQLEYVQAGDNSFLGLAIAMQRAVNNGVDVVNFSGGYGGLPDPTLDIVGINAQVTNAFNAGVLMTFSPGDVNGGTFSTSCNQAYPSNRSEGIAVNGINTTYTAATMDKLQVNPGLLTKAWATSGCTINVYGPDGLYHPQPDNSLGPVAAGTIGMGYYWNSSTDFGYLYGNPAWGGSSFSSPIVAGAAGLLRDAFFESGFGVRPNFWLKTDLLMLTDGYNFTAYNDGGGYRRVGGTSPFSGTGRLQLRAPVLASFPAGNWQWTWTSSSLSNGGSFSKTVPANVQHYRLAAFWQETDLSHVADIDVYVDAVNANGTICKANVAYQADYSIINAVHIKNSDIGAGCAVPGVNLRVTFVGYAIPPGQSRLVWLSDLFDNETAGNGY